MKMLMGVLMVLLYSCAKPQAGAPLDDLTNLAAYLDGGEEVLYVRADKRDAVLHKLQATVGKDSLYTLERESVTFRIVTTNMPYLYAREMFDLPRLAIRWKIYFNAQCGQKHPGFVSPCLATFGQHQAFGQSMIWSVNNWHSCMSGDSLCIEKYKSVGTITYYPDANCQDSTFVTRDVMEFRCD